MAGLEAFPKQGHRPMINSNTQHNIDAVPHGHTNHAGATRTYNKALVRNSSAPIIVDDAPAYARIDNHGWHGDGPAVPNLTRVFIYIPAAGTATLNLPLGLYRAQHTHRIK